MLLELRKNGGTRSALKRNAFLTKVVCSDGF